MVLVTTGRGGATGSGFAIQHDGTASYLVTNNHVVEGASKVQVLMPDGRHFTATVQGTDAMRDVAVIKIQDGSVPLAAWGSSSSLRTGDPVVAIGSPLGNQGTVTSGIISAPHRTVSAGAGGGQAQETLPDVLQTDAAINPGNSGGPLADASGKVVGINTAASQGANNIGFAIPSDLARRIVDALIAGRKPGNPYLGVGYDTEDDAIRKGTNFSGYGVIVTNIIPSCPADKAGVRVGDTIEKVDGIDLNNGQTLGGVIQVHNPGDQVTLTLVRGNSTSDVRATLIDRPSNDRC
jgi:serine protease Do